MKADTVTIDVKQFPEDLEDIVDGVTEIVLPGVPGPVCAINPDRVPVVAGDEDTSRPSVFADHPGGCAVEWTQADAKSRYQATTGAQESKPSSRVKIVRELSPLMYY